jgi:hypothetical protein
MSDAPMQASDPVERQVDAYNSRDIDAFLACYGPDIVIEDAAGSVLMRGEDAMRSAYAELFAASSNLQAEIAARIRIGAYVIDEERITGLRDSADEVRVVAIYHVAAGVIDHVRLIR